MSNVLDKHWIIDTAEDVDPQDEYKGYTITKSERYDNWREVLAAWNKLPDSAEGHHLFLARKQKELIGDGYLCTTMDCK